MLIALFWYFQTDSSTGWQVMFPVFGLCIGALLAGVIRHRGVTLNRKQTLAIILGWGLAFLIGQLVQMNLFGGILEATNNERTTKLITLPLEAGFTGLIGTLFLENQLGIISNRRVNWKTVLAGFIGFGLGNLLANIIVAPMEETTIIGSLQMLIWGLVGGASLAVPSKNYKDYLILGVLGGLGMALGYLASIALGNPDGINRIIIGLVMGAFLGFKTRRLSAALILAVVVPMGYFLRSILNNYYYSSNLSMADSVTFPIIALTAGLMGAIIGTAWSFLTPENQSAK
jgi:hypothetical protein